MIGNDIVALGAVSNNLLTRKNRFLNKLFLPCEQLLINHSTNPETTVWLLWSMKESAWKAHHNLRGHRLFNPKSFECSITSELLSNRSVCGNVQVEDANYSTQSVLNTNLIHSVAGRAGISIDWSIVSFDDNSPTAQSVCLREQLLKKVALKFNINASGLVFSKSESGIPAISFNGKRLPVSCSLSHHGHLGAYALSL